MDVRAAMRETIRLAKIYEIPPNGPRGLDHLESMLARAEADQTMSDRKLGSWLGWMQCAVTSHRPREACEWDTLELMKQTNKQFRSE
jgi:hypothetical protein